MLCEDNDFISAVAQPLSSHREMAEILKKAVVMFENEGIVCGFYIKSLIGHFSCDQFALPYQKFVGENGEESLNELCILDKEYVEYMKELFTCYAECGFESMMVDDDFRSLNHCNGQRGCFCDLHIQETSKLYGEALTRQEVISAMQAEETDEKALKIRECFRTANFAGQLYAAKCIEEAVHSVSKKIRVGLMSGTPEGEEYQGRDMDKLLSVFAGGGNKPYFRPAGGYYFDTLGDALFYGFLNGCETMRYLSKEIEYISEVDIYTPRNSFTKSVKMLDLQLKCTLWQAIKNIL